MKYILSVVLIVSFCNLFAWDGAGHMTGGAIAYYYLKEHNPKVLSKVLATLALHPWFATRWNDKMAGLTADEKEVRLFMLASTYSDDARSIPELGGGEMGKWHYVDYPFAVGGVTGANPQTPNAEEKITELLATIKQENDAQKAVDIAWLFHLIEDVHQPLHTVSLFDSNHPNGDKGGNGTYITFDTIEKPIKLHSYWDRLIKGTTATIPERAKELLNDQAVLNTDETADSTTHDWIKKESYELAVSQVYGNGAINGTKEHPGMVTKDYAHAATALAKRRIYLAGIRLAMELVQLYS